MYPIMCRPIIKTQKYKRVSLPMWLG